MFFDTSMIFFLGENKDSKEGKNLFMIRLKKFNKD